MDSWQADERMKLYKLWIMREVQRSKWMDGHPMDEYTHYLIALVNHKNFKTMNGRPGNLGKGSPENILTM